MKKATDIFLTAVKILLVIFIISASMNWTGFLAVKNIFTYHLANYNKLGLLKDYVICQANLPTDKANDYVHLHLQGEKYKKLFEQENKRGGVYILVENWLATSDFLRPEELKKTLTDPNHEHFFINNFIKINNNYLKINPIIDTNENVVDMSWAENEDKMYALVPEKYKKYEEKFLKSFKEFYAQTYIVDKNIYLEEIGQEPEQVKEREVEIIYVKDNQKYINYYTYWGTSATKADKFSFIPDPIALIVNPVNMGNDTYFGAFSTGAYKIKKIDGHIDNNDYKDLFKQVGLTEEDLYSVVDSYDFTVKALYGAACRFIVPILLLLLICFIQAKLYINGRRNMDISIIGVIKNRAIAFVIFSILTFGASYVLGYYISVAAAVITVTLLAELFFILLKLRTTNRRVARREN